MYARTFAGRKVRSFGLRAVPFLGLFEWVLDRLVRVEVVGLYAGRSAVGAHDLVFLGVNRVRARPMLREHIPAYRAHELRIRHYSTPFSSLPHGTRVRTPSALSSPPTPATFLPGFVRNVYRLAMGIHTERVRTFVTLRLRIRSRVTGPSCVQLDEGSLLLEACTPWDWKILDVSSLIP